MEIPKLITIVGPTAVGKTDLTIALAKRLGTSVISGDAYQVYRGLDIGSAKPTMAERQGVPHYLIDIVPADGSYSVADFQREAMACILAENRAGRIPILSGGTGLYVQALLEGYGFSEVSPDFALRERLEKLWETEGIEGLRQYAETLAAAEGITLPATDKHRLFRAIELLEQGGGDVLRRQTKEGLCFQGPVIGLQRSRDALYERINQRVVGMLAQGLEAEVRGLYEAGLTASHQAMKGIGYKEWIPYFEGEISYETLVDTIQKHTRHFAKRQVTWYKRMPYISWITLDADTTPASVEAQAMAYIQEAFGEL